MWQPKVPPVSVPARGGGRPRPLYLRIVDALAADVAAGRVSPETQLPTQRELAHRLGTTIATITRAYAEARRRGLVSATVGRGTFVHGVPARGTSGIIDLTLNQLVATPFGGELAAAAATVDSACARVAARIPAARRQPAASPHRRRVGRHARRAGDARRDRRHRGRAARHPHGARDADEPGDAVLAEAVTYTGLISLAKHLHLRLVPVAMDAGGLDVDAFARAAKRTGAKVAYVLPTLQNPTGVTLSTTRRKALLQAAAKHGVTLIEDDEIPACSRTRRRSPPTRPSSAST